MSAWAPFLRNMGRFQKIFAAGTFGVFLAYGAFQFSNRGDEREPVPGGSDSTELRKLKEQIRKLEGAVASSERLAREAQVTAQSAHATASQRMETSSASTSGFDSSGQRGSDESTPSGDTRHPLPEPSPQELVEQMDERFFDERIDPGWSHEATTRAEQLRTTLSEGSRIVSLDCRSSMCRVEMSHPNLETFQGFIHKSIVGGTLKWDGPLFAALKSDPGQPGEVQAVAYLARKGVELSPASLEGR